MSDPCDLLQLFQLCRRRYAAALHPVERTWGLTRNVIDVFLFLSNHPGLDTARDIVALRSLSKSHVCKSVDRLTRRGFLAGAQDAQDRRYIHLRLLPAAAGAVRQAQQAQRSFFQALFQTVAPEDRQVLNRVIGQFFQNMKEASDVCSSN